MINRTNYPGNSPYFKAFQIKPQECSPRQDEIVESHIHDLRQLSNTSVCRDTDTGNYIVRVKPSSDSACHKLIALTREQTMINDILTDARPLEGSDEKEVNITPDIRGEQPLLKAQEQARLARQKAVEQMQQTQRENDERNRIQKNLPANVVLFPRKKN